MGIIDFFLKSVLTPIMAESLFESARQIWQSDKLSSLVLYLTGFILTPLGMILIASIVIYFKFFRKS